MVENVARVTSMTAGVIVVRTYRGRVGNRNDVIRTQ